MRLIDDANPTELDVLVESQRSIWAEQSALAVAMVGYIERRGHEASQDYPPRIAELEASFAPDELGAALRMSTKRVQDTIARTRRMMALMPSVLSAWRTGLIDEFRVLKIDAAAQRLVHPESVTLLDEQVVDYASAHTPSQLQSWLNRFVAKTEADQFSARHEQAMKDRRVTVTPDADGVSWISGIASSADANAIDAELTRLARSCGAGDSRTMDQRRADIYADLLLGRLRINDGELVRGTGPRVTMGIVVPVDSLAGLDETPGELLDRATSIPAAYARQIAAEPGTLFYRLLTDPLGHLLDVAEIGRFPSRKLSFALAARDGQCAFPTCTAPATTCDKDHTVPWPAGETSGDGLKHLCRRHHRAKTQRVFRVSHDGRDYRWHLPGQDYRISDEPLPVGKRRRTYSRCESILAAFVAHHCPP